jgi:hypothetical protein
MANCDQDSLDPGNSENQKMRPNYREQEVAGSNPDRPEGSGNR